MSLLVAAAPPWDPRETNVSLLQEPACGRFHRAPAAVPEISYRGNRRNRRKEAKLLTADGADGADNSNKTICENLRNLRLMDWKESSQAAAVAFEIPRETPEPCFLIRVNGEPVVTNDNDFARVLRAGLPLKVLRY